MTGQPDTRDLLFFCFASLMGFEGRLFVEPMRPQPRRGLCGAPRTLSLFLYFVFLFSAVAHADSGVISKNHEDTLDAPALAKVADPEGADAKETNVADLSTKVTAAVLIFFCAILGALPAFVVLRRKSQQQQQNEAPLTNRGPFCTVVPSCCSSNYGAAASACCFGASPFYVRAATVYTAGVVAAVSLLHLLPAADRRLSKALEALEGQGGPRWGAEYPAAALCCLVGLLLSAALEAVVEQQQKYSPEEEEEVAPTANVVNIRERAPLTAVPPVQPEAAAVTADRDGLLPLLHMPFHWEQQRGSAARGTVGPCCCVADVGGAPCRGLTFDVELQSAPPGPVGRNPPYCAATRQSRSCCAKTTCCSSNNSSSSREKCQIGRDALAAARPLTADACTSTSSNREYETSALSCPYTLMDEGTIGSAHTQQRKQRTRGDSSQEGSLLSPGRGGPQEGSVFVGGLLMTGLSVHSVMEGLTLGAAPNPKTIAVAILFHKTLEAFAVGSSLLHVRVALRSYVLQMLFYALTAPFGVAGGLYLQYYVDATPTNGGAVPGYSPYLQLIPGFLLGLGAGAFLHVGLLEILASELQRCRRERRGDMLPMIGLTAVGALCMAFL